MLTAARLPRFPPASGFDDGAMQIWNPLIARHGEGFGIPRLTAPAVQRLRKARVR